MEPMVSSETSATKSQPPGNYPKRNKLQNRCYLLFYYTYDILNMFRALLFPSSGDHDYSAITTLAVRLLGCTWLEIRCRQTGQVSGLQAIICSPETYPAYLYLTSNQQQPKNRTAHVVISTIVVSSWWWAQHCPKHVELLKSVIKQ